MAVHTTCQECGATFTVRPSVVQRRRYCSVACTNEAFQKRTIPPEQRQAIAQALRGIKRSAETRRRVSESKRGTPGRKGSANPMWGKRGAAAANWRGGRRLQAGGYVLVWRPDHPDNMGGYVLEHRLVMEQKLGRRLLPTEIVHHINKRRDDNGPENLLLFGSHGEHCRHEWSEGAYASRLHGGDIG